MLQLDLTAGHGNVEKGTARPFYGQALQLTAAEDSGSRTDLESSRCICTATAGKVGTALVQATKRLHTAVPSK